MTARKKILLVDAVPWSAAYPDTPLRNVGNWFRRHLTVLPDVELHSVSAESDLALPREMNAQGAIISGSPRDAWSDDPVNDRLCAFVRTCRDRGFPLLGVCYGHQIIARALGGSVARHPDGWEVGNTSLELTPVARQSPLFTGLPSKLDMLSSHMDSVQSLPGECELLVTGEFTRIQGFHWRGRLFGVQFHPEMDPEIVRFLWAPRRDRWRGQTSFDLDHALNQMQPTPHGGQIIRNFVQNIVS